MDDLLRHVTLSAASTSLTAVDEWQQQRNCTVITAKNSYACDVSDALVNVTLHQQQQDDDVDDAVTCSVARGKCPAGEALVYYSFLLICSAGVCGNLLSFVVFQRTYTTSKTSCMVLLLKSLAVADTLYLLCETYYDTFQYFFPSLFNDKASRAFAAANVIFHVAKMAQYASVWHLVIMAAFRYLAICHVFKSRKLCTTRRTIAAIVVTWTLAVCLQLPFLPFIQISQTDKHVLAVQQFYEIYLINALVFVFPVVVLLVFTSYVLHEVWKKRLQITNELANETRTNQTVGVTKFLIAILVVFFVTYAPYPMPTIDAWFYDGHLLGHCSCAVRNFRSFLYFKTQYISSCANFFIYYVMLTSFRRHFHKLFGRCYCCCDRKCRPWMSRQQSSSLRLSQTRSVMLNGSPPSRGRSGSPEAARDDNGGVDEEQVPLKAVR